MSLSKCIISNISPNYTPTIIEIGQKWRKDPNNPMNDSMFANSVNKWDLFIKNWSSDVSIPLLIRKKDAAFGSINLHSTGRKLIPVDNSPAQWVFACVCTGIVPPNDIVDSLNRGDIPVAMVLPKIKSSYKGLLKDCPNMQSLDWYLGHKKDVGLKKKMFGCAIGELTNHFVKLMSPSNMFVVPKDKTMRGLAELNDFSAQQ